jgi:hypothetical protein
MKGVTDEDVESLETAEGRGLAVRAIEGGEGLGCSRQHSSNSSRGEQLGNTPLLKS